MKTILFAVLVVLVVAVSSERRPPQLPQAYKATVTADLPFFGKVTGDEYYDYFSQAIRQDFSIFGQEMRSYMLYNTKKQFNIYPQSGQCEVKPLQGDIYPAFIPPFAVYKGDEQIDGIKCEHWYLDWFGTELSFYPTNLTGSGGDKPQNYLKRLRINMFGMKTQLDYKNVVPERPPASTFDISGFPSCKPPPPPPKVWTVKGYLKNAVNNQVIKVDNSRVQLKNTVTGNTVQARISDGLYTAEKIEQGVYVVNASVPGYLIATKELTVESNIGEGTFADMFLSPRLDSNQWRAILTWGNVPRDLDAHTTSSTGCHVSYSKKSCSTSYGTVVLDYDVTAGFGPETTTFSSITDGSYLFFIYNYSGDSNFMSSGAKVRLYNANGLVQEWNVPTSGYSASYRYWKVFTLDGKTGQVTPINQVVSSV